MIDSPGPNPHIAIVIPAYKANALIRKVITGIPAFVSTIIVVDDCSPDNTSDIVQEAMLDEPRLELIRHERNQGVGGAMLTGYAAALSKGADIIIKLDSDDQMDPAFIKHLVAPIAENKADYTKGNRFLHESQLQQMPVFRRIGNLGLSFLMKLASGYWNIFDPTNGYTAVRAAIIPRLNTERIDRRYFFESSFLIELGLLRAVVKDISIPARYGSEVSSLSEVKSLFEFPPKLLRGLLVRILYQYFIRDFTPVTLFLIFGVPLSLFGLFWGIWHWIVNGLRNVESSTGTVMVAVLPLIVGTQLLLQAVVLDVQNVPTEVLDQL